MRILTHSVALVTALTACQPDETKDTADTASDTAVADSSDTADTSGADTADSGDTADTANESVLTWTLDTEVARAQLALHPLDIRAFSSGTPAWFAVAETPWRSVPAYGTQVSIMDDAPDASLLLDDGTGMRFAAFVAVLADDPDGNAARDASERYLGASRMLLFWVEGTISPEAAATGVLPGWNAVDFRDAAARAPLDAIPLPVVFMGSRSVTVEGDGGAEPAPDGIVIGARSGALAPVASVAWSDPWSLTLTDAPPADHVTGSPDSGLRSAMEDLFAWTDADASGAWSSPDDTRPLCTDAPGASAPVRLFWLEGDTTNLAEVVYAGFNGLRWGWNAVVAPSHDVIIAVSADQAASLTLVSTCSWP